MSSPFTSIGDSLFDEKAVLREDYQPDEILERDDEIEQFSYALQDILYGRAPENVMLYGKAGLGKTAVTTYLVRELHAKVTETDGTDDLYTHEQNCNGNTLFQVVRRLVNDLLPDHASLFPKRGLGTGDAFEELYEQLDRVGGTHLFILDEIDHLEDANTLLYELPRARSNGHVESAKLGVIGISNNYTFRDSLSPKVKDTLMETEISFSPYDAEELQTILRTRADRGFVDGACDQSAIQLAAAVAARDAGNARQALDLLRTGGEVAEKADDETVRDSHVEEARAIVQRGRAADKIRDQTEHAQLILEALAHLETAGSTPARTKAIQSKYETAADANATDPLTTLKSVQEHLSDLHMLGFLRRAERNKGKGGGKFFEYGLDIDPDVVIETRRRLDDA
ncbi:Cdc6/Cdc18 family protein [Haloarchaeobius sp. DFWS5]|uniref:Cdc6/Cdc18 family protein n=1 Tax=Haloarchaeobius sp. DFWS5 TaxID=3446114 RepID=UPI003EBA9ECE